jgi:hypothetical protein
MSSQARQPYYSDTLFVSPRDIVFDGRGGLYVIDAGLIPATVRGGASIELLQKRMSVFSTADFRDRQRGPLAPMVALPPGSRLSVGPELSRGIFRVDRMGMRMIASSFYFRRPTHIAFAANGGMMVGDETADPVGTGELHGAIFRQLEPNGQFEVFIASRRTTTPGGFFL